MFMRNYRAVSLTDADPAEYNLFGRPILRVMEIALCTRVDGRFVSSTRAASLDYCESRIVYVPTYYKQGFIRA